MALKFSQAIGSQEQLNAALAKKSKLYSEEDLLNAAALGNGDIYNAMLVGTSGLTSSIFNDEYYKRLNIEDKLSYLNYSFYETDSEKKKLYKEYFDYKYDEAIDAEAYAQLNGFEKFINSVGGVIGNAMNDLFVGTAEGILDATATIMYGVSGEEKYKTFIKQDTTGYTQNREDLQRWIRANTYIDKSGFWKVTNEVVDSIAKMTPMFVGNALAPFTGGVSAVAGQTVYFGAMAGNTAEEAVRVNPDISSSSLFWYTAAVTGVEFATEKISSLIFPSATDVAAGMGSATKRAAVGNIFARIGLDFASEFTEEFVSEFLDSVLYQQFVDQSAEIASFSDCFYAGVIGGLTGALMAGGELAFTKKGYITSNGELISWSEAKKQGLTDGTKLSKIRTLNLKERIAAVQEAGSKSYVTDLQNKYKGETLQDIQKNHAEEYNRAIEKDAKYKENLAQTILALSKILDDIGAENFNKAVDIANSTYEDIQRTANNYTDRLTGKTAAERAIEKSFNDTFGEFGDSFAVSEGLTLREQELQKALAEQGINVHFGKIGNNSHLTQNYRVLGNQIFLDSETTANMSLDTILNKVVNEALVDQCVDLMNALSETESKKLFNDLVSSMGLTSADFNDNFKKAMAERLLFDEKTISMSMITNHSITDKIYNLLHKQKNLMDHQKTFKKKDKVKYNKLAKIMEKYRNVLASEIGNAEDLKLATEQMGLTAEEALDVENKYLPDYTTAHYTWLKDNHTINVYNRKQATRFLLNNRVVKDADTGIDYENVFNSNPNEYYTEAFINQIMSRDPSQSFDYNLNEYLISTYNMVIHPRSGCIMEVVDYTDYTSKDFDKSLEMLALNPNALEGYETLDQLFNKKFNKKFLLPDGSNELSNVRLNFVVKEQIGVTKAQYDRNVYEIIDNMKVPMRPTITVFVKPTMTTNDIAALRHNVLHEATHALSDMQGLSNGVSSKYVRQSLIELNNDAILHRIARIVLTNEFYQENKNNKQVLLDNVAYQIYALTDGEFAAEAFEGSKIRQGDDIIRLMSGSAMNKSGFIVNGKGQIVGFGKFNNITLPTPMEAQVQGEYTSKAFKNAPEITATQEEAETTVGKMAPVDVVNDNIEKFKNQQARDFRKAVVKNYLNNFDGISIELDKTGKVKNISGLDSFIRAGFSEEFYDAVKNNNYSKEKLSALISPTDKTGFVTQIGTEERTNEIIKMLYPDNTYIKSYADLIDVLRAEKNEPSGLTYASVYAKNNKENFKQPHTLDELKVYFKEHPEFIEDLFNQEEKTQKLLIGFDNIYNKLLKLDYDYSAENTRKIFAELGERSETSKKKTETISLSDEKAAESASLVEDTESNVEEIVSKSMEKLSPNAKRVIDNIDLSSKDAFDKINSIRKSFDKEQLQNLFEESYDYVMNEYLKTKSEYNSEIKELQNKLDKYELTEKEKTTIKDALSELNSPADYGYAVDELRALVSEKQKSGTLKETRNVKELSKKAIHYGTLQTEQKAESLQTGVHNTGGFGTGTYFMSEESTDTSLSRSRNKNVVDISEYKTFNPKTSREAIELHDALNEFHKAVMSEKTSNVEFIKTLSKILGVSENQIKSILTEAREKYSKYRTIEKVNKDGSIEYTTPKTNLSEIEKPQNYLMKKLGYEGINVLGLSEVDDSKYGSVIYDLKIKPKKQELVKETPKTKQAKQSEKIVKESNIKSKDSDAIADKIINIAESSKVKESTVQEIDEASKEYQTVSRKTLVSQAATFALVNNENYEEIRNKLKGDKQALILFDQYTLEMLGKFSPEIREKISNANREEITAGMQRGALQQQRIAERKPISHAIAGLANEGIIADVSDETLAKLFPELKEKDLKIAELTKQIEELNEQIKQLSDKNAEQAEELLDKQKQLANEKIVLENGSNADIADFELNKIYEEGIEGADKATKMASKMFEDILTQAKIADEKGKKVALITVNENGEVIAFPELKQKLYRVMDKMKSFRMWAMLSSPVTWIRNFVGNQGMRVLEKFTNGLERVFTKDMSDKEFADLQQKKSDLLKQQDELTRPRKKLDNIIKNSETNIEQLKETLKEASTESEKKEIQSKIDVYNEAVAKSKTELEKWHSENDATAESINKQIKGIEFEMHQKNLNLEKASVETRKYIEDNFEKRIYDDLYYSEGKYAVTQDEKSSQARNMKLEALKVKMEKGTGFQKLIAWAQYAELYNLEEGFLGDTKMLMKSALENLSNMVESNKTYFNRILQARLKTTTDPAKKAQLQEAVDSNDVSKLLNFLPKEEVNSLVEKAESLAAEQYFKNSNVFSRWVNKIGQKNRALGFVASLILPFPKVAANILSMAYKYSPLGFVKALKQWGQIQQFKAGNYENFTGFEKADFRKTMSRATIGSFMLVAGALLTALGLIDIDDDDYLGPSLNIGFINTKISLSNLAPSMTTFSTAAAITWAFKEHKNPVNQALDTLYDNTLLGNVENIFKYGSIENWAKTMPISWAGQYVPAVLKLITKSMTDGNVKDKTSSNYLFKVARTLGSYIPIVSYAVPNKVNPYTGEVERTTGSNKWIWNFLMGLSPVTMKVTKKSAIEKEADRLNTKTTGLSGDFTINGNSISVDRYEKESLAKYRANYINNRYNDIKSGKEKITVKDKKTGKYKTTTYDRLSDEEKSTVLNRIYDDATEFAKVEYWTSKSNNYYVVTTKDNLKEYRKSITNSSKVIYKQKWDKSKFITR